ncbi:PH domain-containing protein [Bacteroides sp. 51]|uniref:PH domain-containing protein n=1 Tax=Bacteroides sp. 51 TaxID=2302938 RepID=UPI0013D5052B|nr:PH domain-containing protein [Bacteroides sp. 51]NDV80591.1 ABC transporter [Bacteroides sp. 51]
MNRIFHVRIAWYQYLYLILLGGLSFFLLWDKSIILAAICMIMLVLLIERFIHTTYTITTDGRLILSSGRFSKPKTIWLKDIISVERRTSVRIGNFSVLQYVMIGYGAGRYLSVLPLKEQEFIDLLETKRKELIED